VSLSERHILAAAAAAAATAEATAVAASNTVADVFYVSPFHTHH